MKNLIIFSSLILLSFIACSSDKGSDTLMTGAERINEYMPLIEGRRLAIVANQTSTVGDKHLVDTLLSL